MKILQVIGSLGTGGAEKLLLDTIPLYRKKGIEMDIVIFWNNNHQFVNALKNINCCNIIIFNESKDNRDIYNFSNIKRLGKLMAAYDIAHVHLFPAQYYAVLSRMIYKVDIKLVFTEHNTSNRRMESTFGRIVDRFFYKRYNNLIFISKEIETIFKKTYSEIKSWSIIQNGVNIQSVFDSERVDWISVDKKLVDKKIILQVSAFRKQKDQKTLIKSLHFLHEDYVVVLVGDGETREECEKYVEMNNLVGRVFFLGQRMDVFRLLKSAECIVLSSAYEGLSLSSIEGMASGRPFIASEVPGLQEIVGGYGLLFPFGNAEKLAECILELENKEYSDMVIERCIKRSLQFNIDLMVTRHIALYSHIIKESNEY